MNINNVSTGRRAEKEACRFLQAKGYTILERNYHYGHIDIDIIAMDKFKTIVFVEVKYRSSARYQDPLVSVDRKKQNNISIAAVEYMTRMGYSFSRPCRFDVIGFLGDKLIHVRNAFELSCHMSVL